jgi:N-carbamoylputrescine amidase
VDTGLSGESEITVACIQMRPVIGAKRANLEASLACLDEAAANGARLVVLPELANSGYMFEDRAEAFALAEEVPAGETTGAWIKAAQRHNLHIIAGIAERAGAALYNCAVVIGPSGYIGAFRKMHLWNSENLFFEPGDLGFPVFRTPIGRIGVAICYDGWFPETFRLQALQGADIVCVPTNWVPIPGQEPGRQAMANILHQAAAHANSIFIACADRVGLERGQPFEGQSVIVGPTGWLVAGPASREAEEIIYARINLSDARRKRNWNTFNQVLRDRRTDVYGEMLGADIKRGWY